VNATPVKPVIVSLSWLYSVNRGLSLTIFPLWPVHFARFQRYFEKMFVGSAKSMLCAVVQILRSVIANTIVIQTDSKVALHPIGS
jgi:hypothetical protein